MSKINPWIIVIGALAVGGFIWAINEKNKRVVLEKKILKKENDYLHLLSQYLTKENDLPEEIKAQIINLRKEYIGIQDDIAIELQTVIDLIEQKKEEIAIEKLTKIIENILKDKLVEEGKLEGKRKCPALAKMLEKALEFNWITRHEFNFSLLLKDNRNEEAHDLAVNFPRNWKMISFLAGIQIIYQLKGIK